MKKPRVLTKCVANQYTSDGERIIEFTFPNGEGGLISFDGRWGKNRVHLYRLDRGIKVTHNYD